MMQVAIKKCFEYDVDLIYNNIIQSIDLINIENKELIKENDTVFIKLNLVGPFEKERGITTHPTFLKAIIRYVKKYTNNIIVGDNPAVRDQIFTMKKTGIYDVIKEENVQILDQKKTKTITYSNYKVYNKFEVTSEMIDCDVLINLPKLKTHSLAYMTCAQKNFFGTIYGLNKSSWHVKANSPLEFADAINDLYGAILEQMTNKTMIHICDGIVGLEGEGPSSAGITKKANIILTSFDAVSLDRVACEVTKLNHQKLFITNTACVRKIGEGDINNIEILGDSLNDFQDLSFLEPKDSLSNFGLKILKIKPLRNLLLEHPVIEESKCIKCGECVKICPPKTMIIKKKDGKVSFPKLKAINCIRCWCCSEVCPQNAIKKNKRPLLGKILFK